MRRILLIEDEVFDKHVATRIPSFSALKIAAGAYLYDARQFNIFDVIYIDELSEYCSIEVILDGEFNIQFYYDRGRDQTTYWDERAFADDNNNVIKDSFDWHWGEPLTMGEYISMVRDNRKAAQATAVAPVD